MSGWTLFFAVGLPLWLLLFVGIIIAVALAKNFITLNQILKKVEKIVETFQYETPKIAGNITKTTDEIAELVRSLKDTVDVLTMTMVAGKTNFKTVFGLIMPLLKKGFQKADVNPVKEYLSRKKRGGSSDG